MSKKLVSIAVAAVLLASMAASLCSCEMTYDYVATVKSYAPFQEAEYGFTKAADCGTVIGKYVDSPNWESRADSGTQYVDLKGKLKGSGEELFLIFRLTPVEGEKGIFLIETHSLEIDGEANSADEAAVFLYYMYSAYEGGFGSVDDFFDSLGY